MNKGSAFGYSLGWTKNKVHILKTLAFPNSATRHCNLEHNVVSFSTTNKGRAFGYSLGWTKNRAFHSLEHNVVSPSLLGRVVTARNYSAATSLYKNMCLEGGIPASRCSLNILMNSFCLEGKVDFGFSLLGTFFKRGILPDVTTCNILLRGLFRENRESDALELGWKIVDDKLCQPNAVTCWIAVMGLWFCEVDFHAHLIDDLFDLAQAKYSNKNVTTYNELIKGFGDLGNWNEVKRLWIEMLSSDVQPSLVTYNILIKSLTKHGLIKDPKTMVDRACEMITYDRLINICCVDDEARRIFDTVVSSGCVPGVSTFNFILEGLLQSGNCDMARELFAELQPNFDTYTVMLDGLCKNGLDNEAFQLLEKVGKQGMELPMTMYSMILDELHKPDSLRKASLQKRIQKRYKGTYRMIVDGLLEHGLLEEAKVLLVIVSGVTSYSEFSDVSSHSEVSTYLEGLLEGGKYNDVVAYLDKMIGREFGLNSSNMSQVLEFISKKENGLVPSHEMVISQNVKAAKATSTSSIPSFEEAYEDELMFA